MRMLNRPGGPKISHKSPHHATTSGTPMVSALRGTPVDNVKGAELVLARLELK